MTSWRRGLAGAIALAILPLTGAAAQGTPLGSPLPGKPLGSAIEGDRGPRAFLENQLSYERVSDARDATEDELRVVFADQGVAYPAEEIYLRTFKHERIMELWARSRGDSTFTLIKEYPVCALPGQLGPKQQIGDFQVPEGFYFIDDFNPRSSFHLSLRVSYPNLSDRMRGEALSLGGDIYVHGGCETVGCIPVENHNIKEIYWMAARAMDAGQRIIPIHIFPSRMDDSSLRWLEDTFQPEPRLLDFWHNLAEGYQYFENTRQVPWITVAQDGRYAVPTESRLAREAAPKDTAALQDEGPRPLPDKGPRPLPDDRPRPLPDSAGAVPADTTSGNGAGGDPGPR